VIEHLSAQHIEQYRARRMAPAELLSLDEHVGQCSACRQQLRAALSTPSPAQLAARLAADAVAADVHPALEELRRFHRLDAVDLELIASHLETCAACEAQVQPSPGAAQQVEEAGASPNWWVRFFPMFFGEAALTWRLAAAGALIALLVWGVTRWQTARRAPSEVVFTATPSPTPELTSPTPAPELRLALNDGGQSVTLDANGNLTGVEMLAVADQTAVAQALRTGRVATPPWLAELNTGANALMGGPENNAAAEEWGTTKHYALLSPVGVVVANAAPVFTWRAVAGATGYVVTISDPAENYREVAVSQPLTTTRWKPAQPLPLGRRYMWQVTAQTKSGERVAPAAQAPEAKFGLLSAAQLNELKRGEQTYKGRPLPLALLYARLGLLAQAEAALKKLAADNPQAALVQALRRDLRAAKR
jgi:hypothetical protein